MAHLSSTAPCRTPLSTRGVVLSRRRRTRGEPSIHDRTALRHPRPVPARRAAPARRGRRDHPRRRHRHRRRAPGLGGGAAGARRRRRRRRDGARSHLPAEPGCTSSRGDMRPTSSSGPRSGSAPRASSGCPPSESWLVESLTDLGDPQRPAGLVIGVIGGSGGAGATTFACALGQLAARRGRAVVVDADPLGPGVDRVLGLEDRDGVRWDGLCQTTGRLSARSLREAVPRREGPGRPDLARRAARAACRRSPCARCSRPRSAATTTWSSTCRGPTDALVDELAARCDRLLVVVVPTVAGVASAVRICARHPDPGGGAAGAARHAASSRRR